jgi:hypothetical protein
MTVQSEPAVQLGAAELYVRRLPRMNLRTFQARWIRGEISADAVPAAATELLAHGIETPALIWLAGMDGATHWQVAPLVERVFEEAALPPISREAALWMSAYEVATRIGSSAVEPYVGACDLWQTCIELDYPEPLRYFGYLSSDYGEGPSGDGWFDARIRETASELLARMPSGGEGPPVEDPGPSGTPAGEPDAAPDNAL